MSRRFTEDTLPRFNAKVIQCVMCGFPINKKEDFPKIEKADNGDIVRKWNCLNCGMGSYQENVSELQRLGLL